MKQSKLFVGALLISSIAFMGQAMAANTVTAQPQPQAVFMDGPAWVDYYRVNFPGYQEDLNFPSPFYDNYQDPLKLPAMIKQQSTNVFLFSPRHLQWAAYDENGNLVGHGRANGGADFCPDLGEPCHSPGGTYAVQDKGSFGCVSKKFPIGKGGAWMPYCMHFGGGYAIHGSPVISERNASHGCIRVTTDAAKWLSYEFIKVGTKVVVLSY